MEPKQRQRLNAEAVIILMGISGCAVWVALAVVKLLGGLPLLSWPVLCSGLILIPTVLICSAFLLVGACDLIRKLPDINRQPHTYPTLKDAMHGMTLNTIGPIYGVDRRPGEPNRIYEFRILKAAATADKIRIPNRIYGLRILKEAATADKIRMKRARPMPRPATGTALDKTRSSKEVQRVSKTGDKCQRRRRISGR